MHCAHTWHTAFCFLLRRRLKVVALFTFFLRCDPCGGLFRQKGALSMQQRLLRKRKHKRSTVTWRKCGRCWYNRPAALWITNHRVVLFLHLAKGSFIPIDRFDPKQERLWRLSNICVFAFARSMLITKLYAGLDGWNDIFPCSTKPACNCETRTNRLEFD